MGQKVRNTAVARDHLENFLFVVPAVAIFCIFYIYPFYKMINLSLFEWKGIGPMHFVGLANYKELMGDHLWWDSIGHAGYITLIALIFQNLLAFALALACDREIRLKRFYRAVFFIPPVLSEVVVGLIWNWILNPQMQNNQPVGLLNHLLYATGFPQLVHNWLGDPKTAMTTIAVVNAWKGFGWGFIMFLAGLQTIDKQLYEAARVDGAGAWKTFTNVTVPMMLPVILVVVILTVLGCMQVFVLILALVSEGLVNHTDVPVTRIFSAMQSTNRFGYACAEAVIFGAMLICISFILKKLADRTRQL
ncbi:MAG TPA: sugar ABC transporter permease [Candidatus Omnitrophota bacterium]|nr:sugar ABC transporter permease [Candidatus Omnitrophota bacterium]